MQNKRIRRLMVWTSGIALSLMTWLALAFVASPNAAAQSCSSASSVATVTELNLAIDCFNNQTPAGGHAITLTASITTGGVPVTPVSHDNPADELTIDGALFTITGDSIDGQPLITMSGGAELLLKNVFIENNTANGDNLRVEAGKVRLLDVRSQTAPIDVVGGELIVLRSVISNVAGPEAVRQSGGEVVLFASVVAANEQAGIRSTGGSLDVFYTSFFNNSIGVENLSETGELLISGSEFWRNTIGVAQSGGAATSGSVTSSTFVDNQGRGVSIANGKFSLNNSSLSFNGQGIGWFGGELVVTSSVFANLLGGAPSDCFISGPGTAIAGTNNFSLATGCGPGFFVMTDQDLAFQGTFDDHGCAPTTQTSLGCTRTLSLPAGHPALSAGNCTHVPDQNGVLTAVTTDQRQFARKAPCDAGAFETASAPLIAFFSHDEDLCPGDVITWSSFGSGTYQIRIGTTPDGNDVRSKQTTTTFFTVADLPADTNLFVSLRHRPDGGDWTLHDQTTFLPCVPDPAAIFAPLPAGELCAGDQIKWDGPDSGRYQLRIGTTPDGNDVLSKQTTATKLTINDLPADTDLFVSLRHRPDGGSWTLDDQVQYSACTAVPIAVTAPLADGELCIGDQIMWDGPDTGRYQLRIGTTPDGNDVLSKQTTATKLTINDLPADTDLFVSLRHRPDGGSWTLDDQVQYTACTAVPIAITAPTADSEVCPGDQIMWDGPDTGRYRLRIGTTPDGNDVLNKATSAKQLTVGVLPELPDLYVSLRHQAEVGGTWILHDTTDYVTCTRPAIAFTSHSGGDSLCPGETVSWDGPDSGRYRVRVGTNPDASDVLNKATSALSLDVGELPAGIDLYLSLRHQAAGATTWTRHDLVAVAACPA